MVQKEKLDKRRTCTTKCKTKRVLFVSRKNNYYNVRSILNELSSNHMLALRCLNPSKEVDQTARIMRDRGLRASNRY